MEKTRRIRAKVRGRFVEHVVLDKLLELHGGRCGICGGFVNPRDFTVDHIIPASKGGHHSYANTQPAHLACNAEKADFLPDEFRPRKKRKQSKGFRNNGVVRRQQILRSPCRATS